MPSKITLTEPIEGITEITLRPPTFADFVEIGAAATWVSLPNGAGFIQETPSVTGQWISRLSGLDLADLKPLSLRDTLALRDAVFGFFAEAGAPPGEDQNTARINAPTGEASKWH